MKRKLVIFEGIASSGKTTLIKLLGKVLGHTNKIVSIAERETLIPILYNRSVPVAVEFLGGVIEEIAGIDADIIFVDRFHLTHAYRTGDGLLPYASIERKLLTFFDARLVLLTVREDRIRPRIAQVVRIRGPEWASGWPGTFEERIEHYSHQQKILAGFLEQTALPYLQFDTTDKNWVEIAQTILWEFRL